MHSGQRVWCSQEWLAGTSSWRGNTDITNCLASPSLATPWSLRIVYCSCRLKELEFGQCLHFGLAGKLAIIHACKQRITLNTNIIWLQTIYSLVEDLGEMISVQLLILWSWTWFVLSKAQTVSATWSVDVLSRVKCLHLSTLVAITVRDLKTRKRRKMQTR
jgi:hypothetical protein